jgi:hypothetical protein
LILSRSRPAWDAVNCLPALLGQASVQTTAGYAKTDLSQLRTFVDATFAPLNQDRGPAPKDR